MSLQSFWRTLRSYFPWVEQRFESKVALQHVRKVINCLKEGNWKSLQSQLVFPLSYFLSHTILQSGWKTITSAFGPLQQTGEPVLEVGWLFTIARVPVQFRRANLALVFWMTSSRKLLSLQLAMLPSAPWKPPPYCAADTRETSMTLMKYGLRRVHATLTWPSKRHPAGTKAPCVILIGGSGPVDRDSSLGASKPFKDLALGLAKEGIAVCRFDKLASTLLGKLTIDKKTITLSEEYVDHVVDAVRQVRRNPGIDANRVILLGHSLGALIAARLVSIDPSLAGCILLAAPAEPIYWAAVRQYEYLETLDLADELNSSEHTLEESVNESSHISDLRKRAQVADSAALNLSVPADELPFGIGPAYWLEHRLLNALVTLEDVSAPVLILQGSRDYQVSAEQDYAKYEKRFHGLSNFEFHLYKDLNHLFIPGKGKSIPLEYYTPGNVSAEVIGDIVRWIKSAEDSD